MENLKVKIVLTSNFQMMNKSLNNNCKSEEWMFFNKMGHEIQNEKFGIQKS